MTNYCKCEMKIQMKVLTSQDIQLVHDATLNILESTGVVFRDNPEAVKVLEKNGGQADGFRVRFPKELVEEGLARLPDRDLLRFCLADLAFSDEIGLSRGESHIGLIGNAYYLYDYEKGGYRDCEETDLEEKFAILDSLRNIEYDCCSLIFHSERHGGRVFESYDTVEAGVEFVRRRVRDRTRVASLTGRDLGTLGMRLNNRSDEERRLEVLSHMILAGSQATQELLEKSDTAWVWCNPVSPLQYHPEETDGIMRVARSRQRSRFAMISPEVMMGTTGPTTLAGALIQQNAEVLAGTILAQMVKPGTPVIYGCVSAPADLRSAEISQGNFETGLLNVGAVQMADHYGMPSRISPGNTSDRKPSARAAVEMAMGLYMGLAAGGNLITTGLLDSTLMVSYEHLVLMDELIGQIKSVAGGIKMDEVSQALDVIKEHGHPSPGFLTSDHTLKYMKHDIYYSDYTGRTAKSYEEWYEKAHTRVKQVLDRQPADDYMEPAVKERLAAVEARLHEDNVTWRTGEGDWWHCYAQDL